MVLIRKPVRFMVVDDSRVIREQIESILEGGNYEFVGAAQDGLEALREFRVLQPRLVTMDLTMPRIDGTETIRRMMTMDPNVRILVVSALKDKATALKALRLGAHGFLSKPFTTRQLQEAIEKLTANLR